MNTHEVASAEITTVGQRTAPLARMPSTLALLRHPLPGLAGEPLTRLLVRLTMRCARPLIHHIRGIQHLSPANDPFILACNHSLKIETLVLGTALAWFRNGHRIRFLADWNFALIPVVALLLRRGRVILVTNKPARPRFLNRLKPLYLSNKSAFARALEAVQHGDSIGVFPEGTRNLDPRRLLPGRPGTARLSLSAGCPVVPVGIHFPNRPPNRPLPSLSPLHIEVGEPMHPPPWTGSAAQVRDWHARIMTRIAELAGKHWSSSQTPYEPDQQLLCHTGGT